MQLLGVGSRDSGDKEPPVLQRMRENIMTNNDMELLGTALQFVVADLIFCDPSIEPEKRQVANEARRDYATYVLKMLRDGALER